MEHTQSYTQIGQSATIRIEYYINPGPVCEIEQTQRCGMINWIQLAASSPQGLKGKLDPQIQHISSHYHLYVQYISFYITQQVILQRYHNY